MGLVQTRVGGAGDKANSHAPPACVSYAAALLRFHTKALCRGVGELLWSKTLRWQSSA